MKNLLYKKASLMFLITIIIASFQIYVEFSAPKSVNANYAKQFNPGRIIDDAVFYDKQGFSSPQQVQDFINSHTPVCDVYGQGPSGFAGLTRAQYALTRGWHGPPYVCLQNYHENPQTGETSFERGGGYFPGGINAGQIIWDAAQKYSINPKVLLVMLKKESSGPLFADPWPIKEQYKYAMGYGCPDSGPNYSANCVSARAGFYKQVDSAAWQLNQYRVNPNNYNYKPGQVNRILYNPNPQCGYAEVYIENYATAALYNYTPYTPNQAALQAYPGEAACGAYGNRNFWFFYNEWFSSPVVNSNFVRTANDPTVYLISGDSKYTVPSMSFITSAPNLGGVGYVSQSLLDSFTTKGNFSRIIRSPEGTVYFYDSGIKLPFASCDMVFDYGYSCGDSVLLSSAQINSFASGPYMTNAYQTTEGKLYHVDDGVRREVSSISALAANNLSSARNILSPAGISNLRLIGPIYYENQIVLNRNDQNFYTFTRNGFVKSRDDANIKKYLNTQATGALDDVSFRLVSNSSVNFGDAVVDDSGTKYLITSIGKKKFQNEQDSVGFHFINVPTSILANIPDAGLLSSPVLIKAYNNASVYIVLNGVKMYVTSMWHIPSLVNGDNQYIASISQHDVNSINSGNYVLQPGSMVKEPNNATVYFVDGYNTLVRMSNFQSAYDLGAQKNIQTVDLSSNAYYQIANNYYLDSYISCGEEKYLSIKGTLYPFSSQNISPIPLSSKTCSSLPKAQKMPRFFLDERGTIYEIENGVAYHISTMSVYYSLYRQGDQLMNITSNTLNKFVAGPIK